MALSLSSEALKCPFHGRLHVSLTLTVGIALTGFGQELFTETAIAPRRLPRLTRRMPQRNGRAIEEHAVPVFTRRAANPVATLLKTALIALMIATGLLLGNLGAQANAADEGTKIGRETGLPLPRFVSFKRSSVNLRVGPGRKYAIKWHYRRQGLPVEVVQEFDQWRRVRDSDGTTGWVLHSLLSSRRTAIVAPWEISSATEGQVINAAFLNGKDSASRSASTVAKPQAGLQVNVEECNGNWCAVEVQGTGFWLEQEKLWGVYPGETITN